MGEQGVPFLDTMFSSVKSGYPIACPSACLPACLLARLPARPSVRPSARPTACSSAGHLPVYLPTRLPACSPACPISNLACLPDCQPACTLPLRQPACPPACTLVCHPEYGCIACLPAWMPRLPACPPVFVPAPLHALPLLLKPSAPSDSSVCDKGHTHQIALKNNSMR